MGNLLVFAAGYLMGSRAGGETLGGVVDAARAIRESDEFQDLIQALRIHAGHSLRELATMVEKGRESTAESAAPTDLVERVRLIVGLR